MQFKNIVQRLMVAVVLVTLTVLTTVSPAGGTGTSYISRNTWLRSCSYAGAPASSGLNAGLCVPIRGLSAGTPVTMLCWKDDFGSRWFLIKIVDGLEGYIDAGSVGNQASVNNCATAGLITQKVLAADFALSTVTLDPNGQVWASNEVKQYYPPASWSPGPWGEWAGDCIKLAHYAWYKGTGTYSRSGNAINVWNAYASAGRVGPSNQPPPYGSMVFWNYGNVGHVGISVGGFRVVDTHGLDNSYKRVTWEDMNSVGLQYLGWVPIENIMR